jgi:hypothetical protein
VQFRRWRALPAVPALFVLLFVAASVAGPTSHASRTATGSSRHATIANDVTSSPAASAATALTRRLASPESLVGYLVVTRAFGLALLFWIAAGWSAWILLMTAGLNRRGRAPPLVRA